MAKNFKTQAIEFLYLQQNICVMYFSSESNGFCTTNLKKKIKYILKA